MSITRDQLYETAFRYKKAGLWKTLWDSEVFAIKLKSGEIGYISIMGKSGEHNALGLYVGDEAFGSFRLLQGLNWHEMPDYKFHEALLQQKCLQMALESKDNFIPEELKEVRAYCKANRLRPSGKNAYPQFVKYEPNYHPWKVQSQEDMEALNEAMEASILMAEAVKELDPEVMGIISVDETVDEVPLFEVKGKYLHTIGLIPLPYRQEEKYEYITATNEVSIAAVKKLKQQGIWETEFLRMLEPVQNNPEETPHYPALLLCAENKSGYMLPVPIVEYVERNPQQLVEEFAKAWKMQGICPKEVRCRDERTFAMIKDFCEKVGAKVRIYTKEMPALDDAEQALFDKSLGRDPEEAIHQLEQVIDEILGMSDEELRLMPKPMMDELKLLIEHEIFPEEIAQELREKLKGI
ncbi:DUF7309 domain-containing protein [Butyrivibrio sp. INlla14]|uniref:DUF7309 domain-containing protein n=1 Tax=Butyrivibrio sp. INlla14 TaxID=1520808 RepID=UPI0008763016|nr:hypothetical protein [Butyrivibrio sp. INlla14]SCY13988.1 hypothetical protein SAMN02910371_01185 [Butyrivibrio sp. INlla14]